MFDRHLHAVHDAYGWEPLLGARALGAAMQAKVRGERATLADLRFENLVKEVFLDSDTTVGLVSTATSDDPARTFLDNAVW